jgi:hypothetical protein
MYKMSRIRFPALFSFPVQVQTRWSFMKPRNGILAASLLLTLMSSGIALAHDTQSPKQDMKDAGRAIKDATRDIGHAAKKTGHQVKHETKKAVNKSAEKTRQGAKKVKDKTNPH